MLRKLLGLGKCSPKQKDSEAAKLGIDPEMRYCPECGDEFRADIANCATCNVALISGAEKLRLARQKAQAFAGRSMEISAGDPRVAIRGGKLRDLKPDQLLLARERIPSLITGEGGDCRKG